MIFNDKSVIYKPRYIFGAWWLVITDENHQLVEKRGPFDWAGVNTASQVAETEGLRKEQ